MQKQLIFCFIFLCHVCLLAEPPDMLSFQQLMNLPEEQAKNLAERHPQPVRIRGFLYQAADGRLILAAEPNLKSCCVAAAAMQQRQILVTGTVDIPHPNNYAVLLEGHFIVDNIAAHNPRYRLENATLVAEDDGASGLILIIILSALLLAGGMIIATMAKKRKK